MKKLQDLTCLQTATKILGDKWTPLILKELSLSPCTFSMLQASLTGISPRTLSQRLRKLEGLKIICKTIYCERPPRNQYALSQKGTQLKNILDAMADWAAKYC